jgi:hypothetical protein
VPRWPDGSIGFLPRSKLVIRWLQARSETFEWAIAPAELHGFLDRFGFAITASVTPQELSGLTVLDGETLVACVSAQ